MTPPRRNTDLSAKARFFQAAGWSLIPGLAMGLMVTVASDVRTGLLAAGLIVVGAGGGALFFSEVMGRATAHLVHPTGGRRGEFSAPAALAAKGRYREALDAYQGLARDAPDDPLPCLKVARLYAERLADGEAALRWFQQARARGLEEAEDRMVIREMVGVAEANAIPMRMAPELARYAEEKAGTPDESWARETLARLKREYL